MNPPRTTTREIVSVASSRRSGTDYHTRRTPLPTQKHGNPFLFVEEIGPLDLSPGQSWQRQQPERTDFWRLTYLIEGEWLCAHEQAQPTAMRSGDVCWRSEAALPGSSDGPPPALLERGGRLHCLEVALRLSPAGSPMPNGVAQPGTVSRTTDPAQLWVLFGSLLGEAGAFDATEHIAVGDCQVDAGGTLKVPIDAPDLVSIYVYQDVVWIGARGLALREGQLAVLGPGEEVVLRGPERSLRPARLLLLAWARTGLAR